MPARSAAASDRVDLTWPDESAESLALVPLVYVVWSDGVLAPSEMRAICDHLDDVEAIDAETRDAVRSWLRPDAPPSATALRSLRRHIETLRPAAPDGRTLVELGIALAEAAGADASLLDEGPTRSTLERIENALGVVPDEVARRLCASADAADAVPSPSPTFDVGAMTSVLEEPSAAIRHRVLALLAASDFEMPLELPRDEYRERVLAAVKRLADEGLGSLAFPEEFGGADSPADALAAFETLAFGDISVLIKFGVHFGLFGGSVHQLGTEKHHRSYLEDIGSLALPGCFAMTEFAHGSNVRDIETKAVYDATTDELEVHTPNDGASKYWIGNAAAHGRVATVFAQLEANGEEHGVHAILVPIRDDSGGLLPGVRIEDCGAKIGLDGVDNGRIWFDHVRVPRANLLDRFASIDDDGRYRSAITSIGRRFFTMLGTLVAGRISIGAASVSAAKTGLTVAIRYSARRTQFGPSGGREVPILSYLTQQRLLLPRLAATYALHFAIRDLSARYARLAASGSAVPDAVDADSAHQRLEVEAAGLKAYASRHCFDTLQACRESMGGRGYLAANRLGRLKNDTDIFLTFEGANVVLLQLVARGLLSEYAREMGDLKIWDIVKHLADRAGTTVAELNPVVTRRVDDDHLLDPEFHESAFAYREDRLLGSVARRLKARLDEGVDSFDAMIECQDHLVALARAHVERQILGSLASAVLRAPSPGLSETLRTLTQLWALSTIEADRGWFLESGYIEAVKARAIRTLVNRLCGEVADQAPFLVDAFGIPDDVLRAPDGVAGK